MLEDLGVASVIKPSQGMTLLLTPGHSGATAEPRKHPLGWHQTAEQVSNASLSPVHLGALKTMFPT